MLTIRCQFHPRYKAQQKPRGNCETCRLLYALVHHEDQNTENILKEIGSRLVVNTVDEFVWDWALEGMETGKQSDLSIKCKHHKYQATRRPGWECDTCWLLFVLKFQGHKDGERRLGPFNPYYYVIDYVNLRKACANLRIIK